MSNEETEIKKEVVKTERFSINLHEDGKAFLASMKPVMRDVWTRRIKKGRMTKEYVELFQEMLNWYNKEQKVK